MKILGYLSLLIAVCFMGVCLRPSPSVSAENAQFKKAVVKDITEGGIKDAVFHLEEDPHHYYINRGLENTFNLEDLKKQLVGQEVTFVYADHWTPLDWDNKSTHIARLELGGEIIYDEISAFDK